MRQIKRALVIANPTAGQRRQNLYTRYLTALSDAGISLVFTQTQSAEEAAEKAAAAHGVDAVFAAGGDGTVNAVLNGLLRHEAPPALGILPLGTANVVAKEIGLPDSPKKLAAVLKKGRLMKSRVGCVNGRYFLSMASVGFDAHVVAGISKALKRKIGPLAYVWQGIREARRYAFPLLEAKDGGRKSRNGTTMICLNGALYAGRFRAVPEGDMAKKHLSFLFLEGAGFLSYCRYGTKLLCGRLFKDKAVSYSKGRKMEVISPTGLPVEADGDIVTYTPATFSLEAASVRIIIP